MSIFSKIQLRKPTKSVHNLSYSSKLSLDFGRLVPIMCEKVVPGDVFKHKQEFFLRFAPFVSNVFQEFIVQTDYFFVPSRILWKNFEKWISEPNTEIMHPYIPYYDILNDGTTDFNSTLFDYFNLPTAVKPEFVVELTDDEKREYWIDALPFYAYLKIFIDYYIDENLGFAPLVNMDNDFALDGDNFENLMQQMTAFHMVQQDNAASFAPLLKSFPKDYFTSALPTAQMGVPVEIPLDGSGRITINSSAGSITYENVGLEYNPDTQEVTLLGSGTNVTPIPGASNRLTFNVSQINNTATITDLRTASVVASFLEKRGYAGHRYKEIIPSSFGERSQDYRLDRSQLLQRNRNIVALGDVFTTSFDNEDSVPGMAVTTAKSASTSGVWKQKFHEHGYIIGLMCVYPKATYYNGIPRQFMELDQFDYLWPEFQHIGEQEISNLELNADGRPKPVTFGYTPRYAQYKSRTNQLHGNFRTSLEFMTAARNLNKSNVVLDDRFLSINPDYNDLYRIFNVKSSLANSQPVYIDLFHKVKAVRPLSYFSTPRLT